MVVTSWRRVARRLRPSSISRGSTERSPTVVAMAMGKKQMRAQMSTLLSDAAAEPDRDERRERQDGGRLGGHDVGRQQALGERGAGEQEARHEARA